MAALRFKPPRNAISAIFWGLVFAHRHASARVTRFVGADFRRWIADGWGALRFQARTPRKMSAETNVTPLASADGRLHHRAEVDKESGAWACSRDASPLSDVF
jgi:hypothetical protein